MIDRRKVHLYRFRWTSENLKYIRTAAPFNSETTNSLHDALLDELGAFVPLEEDLLRRVSEHRCELHTMALELGFEEKAPQLEPIRELPLRYASPGSADLRSPKGYRPHEEEPPPSYPTFFAPSPSPLPKDRRICELRESDVSYVAAGLEMGIPLESFLSAFAAYRLQGEELLAELRQRIEARRK